MSETSSSTADVPPRPIDRTAMAESRQYGVPYQAYLDMSPRERGSLKGRWVHKLRQEAKRRRIDPDEFVAMSEDAREQARVDYPEQALPPPQKRRPAAAVTEKAKVQSIEEILERFPDGDGDDEPPEAPSPPEPRRGPPIAPMYDEGILTGESDVHSSMDEVPATELDPKMRSLPTLGDVHPSDNEDLVGWKQPKNLLDVYARYSIGDGQHFLRVERIDPKVYQGIPVAGYLGEIRERITEFEFQAWYGGRVYALTVYGPDSKGRRDAATGLPVIKAKTEPFRFTVPVPWPNLSRLPGTNPSKQPQGDRPMMSNPFAFPQGAPPATPADASMHKTNIDFMQNLLTRNEAEKAELRRQAQQAGAPSTDILKIVQESGKDAAEQAAKAAQVREDALREDVRRERDAREALEAKLERAMTEMRDSRASANPVKDAVSLVQTMQPGKSAEEELVRVRQAHMEEMNRIREAHRDADVALRSRHDDELKRVRDRLDEVERHGKERLEDTEKRFREQEKELKDRIEATRREERDIADRRVKETVERFEDRLKDLRAQHERELRMQTEQHTTRVDTTASQWKMQIENQKERIERLTEELEEAREEAEKSKDPVAVMKKGEAIAEAMGFKKEDNGPQTATERFMATVGMGLSKAFETANEWVPRAMEARAAAAPLPPGAPGGPRQLPPGAPQQQPQRVIRQPSKRAVSWASQGSVPVAGHQPTIPPSTEIPFAPPAPAPAPPVEAQAPPMAPPPPVAPPVQGPTDYVQAAPPPNGQGGGAPATQEQAIVEFRNEVERSINVGLPVEVFAQRFVELYPDASHQLVSMYKPENFLEVVKTMPGGGESVILRRDGKRWVEKLWQEVMKQHQARAAGAQGTVQ